MSSSSHRSSSAVRDLRNIFENKASKNAFYDPRGRSPNGLSGSDKENSRPTPKIRASFYAVEPIPKMSATLDQSDLPDGGHTTHPDERRSEFVEGEEGGPMTDIKNSINKEQEERELNASIPEAVPETAVESAAPTPAVQLDKDPIKEATVLEADLPSANPDNPVTGAEEEPGDLKPADPTSADAVSGGDGLPPTAEDLRKPEDAAPDALPKTANKSPGKISTSNHIKAPASSLKSPGSAKPSATSPRSQITALKAGRSSLTAPTAASAARNGPSPVSALAKPKPREPTRPVELSSRLTAPTAAFRAKHEQTPAETSNATVRSSMSGRPSLASSTRQTPRSSLAGGSKPESHPPPRKIPTPDASFLERMMRPTAASQSKVQEKHENRSPGRAKPVASRLKPKSGKPVGAEPSGGVPSHADESILESEAEAQALGDDEVAVEEVEQRSEANQVEESPEEAAPVPEDAQIETKRVNELTSTEAPIPANTVQEKVEALEATPAAAED